MNPVDEATPPSGLPALPQGRMEGHALFVDVVRQALATAAAEGWSRIVLCDVDFADWPLGEREVVASLHDWSARGRTLQLIARDYRDLRERHPRFVQWRVTWSHLVEAHACANAALGELPSAVWSPGWTMERLDPARGTLLASHDAARRVALRERLNLWWQKGTPAFPASTLGL
ncbi:hypothetical protein [Hydrogenophaga sp.]|uniref:hypothetical protein n=1 Tax=Hydrogenophaga sp. TaxID=1904254 RepID=UPI003F707C2E